MGILILLAATALNNEAGNLLTAITEEDAKCSNLGNKRAIFAKAIRLYQQAVAQYQEPQIVANLLQVEAWYASYSGCPQSSTPSAITLKSMISKLQTAYRLESYG